MQHLSPEEQKVLLVALRHRAEYWKRTKRLKAYGKAAKRTLLAAVCGCGLLAGSTTSVRAADIAPVSAAALFNEANAAQRAGRLGPAILDYERAKVLAPRDAAIAQNMNVAREKAGVAEPSVPVWQRPAHWLSFNSLTALASISLLLFCLLVFGTRLIPTTLRGLARVAGSSLGTIALLAAVAVGLRWPELNRAIIIGTQPVAHIAPAQSAATLFELKTGDLVRTESHHGEFVRIRTSDGRSGWVSRDTVETIIPTVS